MNSGDQSLISRVGDFFGGLTRRVQSPTLVNFGHMLLGGTYRSNRFSGRRDVLEAYATSPILMMVARKIASSAASVEWKTCVRLSDGSTQDLPDHAMSRLLNGGAGNLDGYQCRSVIYLHFLLGGESFWVLDRDGRGRPSGRWPIPPHWVMDVAIPGRPEYNVTTPYGAATTYGRDDIVYWKDVDPVDPYGRGVGVGFSLADEINADEAAAQHIAETFLSGGVPRTMVSGTDKAPLDRAAMQRVEETWQDKFAGPKGSAKPFFSMSPIDVKQLAPNFREMEITQLRQFERDMMINVFGIPPEMVGVIENANRATVEAAEFLFQRHVIVPKLEALKATINHQVAPQFSGEQVLADYDSPVSEDAEFVARMMKDHPWAFTADEIRRAGKHDPVPEGAGDVYLRKPGEVFAPADDFAEGGQTVGAIDALRAELANGTGGTERAILSRGTITKADDDDVDRVLGGIGPDEESALESILEVAIRDAAQDFADETIRNYTLDISFDVRDPRVSEAITARAAESSKLITGTTRDNLRTTLEEGVRLGENTDKLVSRIQDTVKGASKDRAKLISRTEITRASNFGTHEALIDAELDKRQWLATFDGNVRDTHARLDGQIVSMDEPFRIDGYSGMYPGDFGVGSMDINCRCGVVPVFDELEDDEQIRRMLPTDPDIREFVWKTYDRRRLPHERRLELVLQGYFSDQSGRLVAQFL